VANGVSSLKKQKAKRGDKGPKGKADQQPPDQFAATHDVRRRFETHERVCEVLCAMFAILAGVIDDHKILTSAFAIIAGAAAFVFWFKDRKTVDAPMKPAVQHAVQQQPSVTEVLSPPILTAPLKPRSRFSPGSSQTHLTPSEITRKIKDAKFDEDSVKQALVGLTVDWELPFSSAKIAIWDTSLMSAWFEDTDKLAILPTMVLCVVPVKDHERLPLMTRTDRFRVTGTIKTASIYSVEISEASLNLI
jgi:hypothetical protein